MYAAGHLGLVGSALVRRLREAGRAQQSLIKDTPRACVGTSEELEIKTLASYVRAVVGSHSRIEYDLSKPDGMPRKLLDVSRMTSLGWRAQIPLREDIQQTYAWYVSRC